MILFRRGNNPLPKPMMTNIDDAPRNEKKTQKKLRYVYFLTWSEVGRAVEPAVEINKLDPFSRPMWCCGGSAVQVYRHFPGSQGW